MAKGVVYLQVVPVKNPPSSKITGLKVVSMTQAEPQNIGESATRVVKLTLEIPDEHLMPLEIRALPDDLRMKADYEATLQNLGKT
jgi:hypothetical protein